MDHLLDMQEELRHLVQNCGVHRLCIKFFFRTKIGLISSNALQRDGIFTFLVDIVLLLVPNHIK